MTAELQQVSFVTGDVSDDGSAIRLRIQTERDDAINLSLPTVDFQHLVTPLLVLGDKAAVNGQFAATSEIFCTRPLPLHNVSLGGDDNQAVMTVEISASILSVSLTAGCMSEIARTMLTITAPEAAPGRSN